MYNYVNIDNIIMPYNLPKIPFHVNYNRYEIDCQLFSLCNLNCKFCFQNKDKINDIDYNYILSIPQKVFPYLKPKIQLYEIKQLTVFSWGGQVFMDILPDEIFDIYKQYMTKFIQIFTNVYPNLKLNFIWTSNGIFEKTQRIMKFLLQTNSKIVFSYDPLYRYNNIKQMNLAIQNFKLFKNVISCIGITLIKPMIAENILNNDIIFNSDYLVDINYYIGNTNYKLFLPNDQDLYKFYKWAINNKRYNFNIISLLLYNIYHLNFPYKRYCDCKFVSQFISNKFTSNCTCYSDYSNDMFYEKYTDKVTESNCTQTKNTIAIQKRNCFSCEYYNICTMFCHISQLFKYVKIDNICPLYRIIEYINQNPFIKQNYLNYLKTHKK